MVLKHAIKKRMAFRSKLARYNTVCCEQVMPVPVIPVCAIGKYRPVPICPLPVIPYCVCDPSVIPLTNFSMESIEMPFSDTSIQSTSQIHMTQRLTIPHYSPLQDHPTGTIVTHSSSMIPNGYLSCDGRFLPIEDYPILFLIIQATYGGDATTFGLPNLNHTDDSSIFYMIKN